jgi:hypothetical protein
MPRKDHPLYATWKLMRQRCRSQKNHKYKNYGARGITIDPAWDSFEQFVFDMGPRPTGTTLDRLDNNGPYSKANCRWATQEEQQNNRSNNRRITFGGETRTMAEWCVQTGIPETTLRFRLNRGWPLERAFHQ